MEKLPAGILPNDANIEFFADPENFGRVFWISEGRTHRFCELPLHVMDDLRDELLSDTKALHGLRLMGNFTEDEALEQYNYCNRGRVDGVPDLTTSDKKTKEYVECGRRDKCPGEDKVCSPLMIYGSKITHREHQCLKLIGIGLPYKRIKIEMGFRRETAVNSLIDRIRDKMHCANNVEIALKVKELGLV
ncbi:MAG: hypothetical protein NTZ69_15805 [Bacteroidia bacterium]|nr:hypothetical protein [Bacteroidia bacterium]